MRRFSDLLKPIFRFVHVHCVCVFAPHQKRFSRLMVNTNNVNITIRHIHVVNVFFLPKNRERAQKNRIQEVQFHYVSPMFLVALVSFVHSFRWAKGGFQLYYTFLCIMYLIIDSLFALLTGALCINKMLKIGMKSSTRYSRERTRARERERRKSLTLKHAHMLTRLRCGDMVCSKPRGGGWLNVHIHVLILRGRCTIWHTALSSMSKSMEKRSLCVWIYFIWKRSIRD